MANRQKHIFFYENIKRRRILKDQPVEVFDSRPSLAITQKNNNNRIGLYNHIMGSVQKRKECRNLIWGSTKYGAVIAFTQFVSILGLVWASGKFEFLLSFELFGGLELWR